MEVLSYLESTGAPFIVTLCPLRELSWGRSDFDDLCSVIDSGVFDSLAYRLSNGSLAFDSESGNCAIVADKGFIGVMEVTPETDDWRNHLSGITCPVLLRKWNPCLAENVQVHGVFDSALTGLEAMEMAEMGPSEITSAFTAIPSEGGGSSFNLYECSYKDSQIELRGVGAFADFHVAPPVTSKQHALCTDLYISPERIERKDDVEFVLYMPKRHHIRLRLAPPMCDHAMLGLHEVGEDKTEVCVRLRTTFCT